MLSLKYLLTNRKNAGVVHIFVVLSLIGLEFAFGADDLKDEGLNSISLSQNEQGLSTNRVKAKAEDPDSDDGFIHSVWGAYLFSIIGLAVFISMLVLLLQYVCGKGKRSPQRNSLVNNNFRGPAQQYPKQEEQKPRNLMTQESTATAASAPQQPEPQYQPYSATSMTNPTTLASFQHFEYQTQQQQQQRPLGFISPSEVESFSSRPVPIAAPVAAAKAGKDSDEEPFKYLEKYSPYTEQTSPSLTNPEEPNIIPKRAVLRSHTPYKTVEDMSKAGSENGESGMNTPQQRSPYIDDGSYTYNYNENSNMNGGGGGGFSYQNNAFEFDNYTERSQQYMYPKPAVKNDGVVDNRFIRVLPRYPVSNKSQSPVPPEAGFRF